MTFLDKLEKFGKVTNDDPPAPAPSNQPAAPANGGMKIAATLMLLVAIVLGIWGGNTLVDASKARASDLRSASMDMHSDAIERKLADVAHDNDEQRNGGLMIFAAVVSLAVSISMFSKKAR